MENHPQCKTGEVYIGKHPNSLIRLIVLPGIRQCTEEGQSVPLSSGSNGHFSSKLPTFAPIEEVRKIQKQARKAGGTPYDLDVLNSTFQA